MIDEQEESFAELFEASLKKERRTVSPGEKVSGLVVQVGAGRLYLDLGDGLDGLIEFSEFPEGEVPQKGERVEGYVAAIENRIAVLAKTLGKGPAARKQLEDSAQTGIPVEGVVSEVNKGGFVVEIAGVRCFCPIGQMDIRRIEEPAQWIGQRLTFRVTEWRSGRDVVVSRRALLEAEQAQKAEKTRAKLEKGARFTGVVTSVRDFGAFVDIGGLEGLVHASELGWGRVRPQDAVQSGQEVEVEVLDIQPPGPKDRSERISLSMRSISENPFDLIAGELGEGDVVRGTVVRLQPFGAFVEIVPGVDGLIHVSAFGKRVGHPAEIVSVGDSVAVRVDLVDVNARRISLSHVDAAQLAEIEGASAPEAAPVEKAPAEPAAGLQVRKSAKVESAPASKASTGSVQVLGRTAAREPVAPVEGAAPAPRAPRREEMQAPPVGTVLQVTVDRIETFGLFVTWPNGRGLLPASELEVPKNSDLRKAFPVGTVLEAAVVDVRPDGKVRLSARGAEQVKERAEAKAWMDAQKPASGKGFGTLGDLLAKSLKKNQE